jgi:hypothetical protein
VRASRPHWAVVLLVVLAHGVALFGLSRPSLRMGRSQSLSTGVMHVHQVPVSSLPEAAQTGMDASSASTAPQVPALVPQERPERRLAAVRGELVRELPTDAEQGAPVDYFPRDRLSVVPQVLTNVDVPFPAEVSGLVDLKVQITVFIDEYGTVRRVRVDSAAIPSPFAGAVLDTFLNARFKPGEVEGVAVRSQIRLEVEFRANRRI